MCYICDMDGIPKRLQEKLARREARKSLRHLPDGDGLIDFSSNDYLGFSRNPEIFERASQLLTENPIPRNGATGSRLLSGNHALYSRLEQKLSEFHRTEAALVFNSGYDANIGFFGCVPQRGDIVFYDEYIHASIRDGIKMGHARSYKFKHNDLKNLEKKCQGEAPTLRNGHDNRVTFKTEGRRSGEAEVYVVTESVFSMDGDSPDIKAFSQFCQSNGYHLIVDEAHAVGVFGEKGEGLVQHLGLQDAVFARIVTFGKAIGCHGAAVLGRKDLKDYLVNFARSLIYTTGLPPHSVATILAAYEHLSASEPISASRKEHGSVANSYLVESLSEKIRLFKLSLETPALSAEGLSLLSFFIPSNSAIHCCLVPGNQRARKVAYNLQSMGFDVRAILSPTVPEGQERLRICLHSFNTKDAIERLLELLSSAINNP